MFVFHVFKLVLWLRRDAPPPNWNRDCPSLSRRRDLIQRRYRLRLVVDRLCLRSLIVVALVTFPWRRRLVVREAANRCANVRNMEWLEMPRLAGLGGRHLVLRECRPLLYFLIWLSRDPNIALSFFGWALFRSLYFVVALGPRAWSRNLWLTRRVPFQTWRLRSTAPLKRRSVALWGVAASFAERQPTWRLDQLSIILIVVGVVSMSLLWYRKGVLDAFL